jgi:hypothetical protein
VETPSSIRTGDYGGASDASRSLNPEDKLGKTALILALCLPQKMLNISRDTRQAGPASRRRPRRQGRVSLRTGRTNGRNENRDQLRCGAAPNQRNGRHTVERGEKGGERGGKSEVKVRLGLETRHLLSMARFREPCPPRSMFIRAHQTFRSRPTVSRLSQLLPACTFFVYRVYCARIG